ncbi:hypothetical protein M3Y99_01183600 [Aphelenchoides fujianensis]|nr:hypothetical protein M3Y99_01183600 [Aphelenchoides fujianensis]
MFCAVCGIGGAGSHFGAISCQCCAKFMRRSVRLGLRFECRKESQCVVTGHGRASCKSCRMAACLRAGMDPKLIRSDRSRDTDVRDAFKRRNKPPTPPPADPFSIIRRVIGELDGPLGFRSPPPALDSADFSAHLRFFLNADRFVAEFEEPNTAAMPKWSVDLSLEEGFLHTPGRLSQRTKMLWKRERLCSPESFVPVACRNIVHFVDVVSHIPELRLLDSSDLLRLLAGKSVDIRQLIMMQQTLRNTNEKCVLNPCGQYFGLEEWEMERNKKDP